MANNSFTLDISRFVQRARGNERAIVKKIFLDLGTAIVQRTPVGDPDTWARAAPLGYVGGRARGSWQYGFNAPNEADPGTIDGTGQASINRLRAGVESNPAFGVHYVTSTIPYMRRLEYEAWSAQAPEGMVRLTVAEFQKFVDDACREANP